MIMIKKFISKFSLSQDLWTKIIQKQLSRSVEFVVTSFSFRGAYEPSLTNKLSDMHVDELFLN